ncbi:inovirus-type Gp2 protein [Pectobacterium versatile]|uniref:rolling circle replication-associated protein n=1 Tax=Pectobacterium versatile TaxID=2488639 RepID=UPI0032ED2D1E
MEYNYPYIKKYSMDWFLLNLVNNHLNNVLNRYSKLIGIRIDFSYRQSSDRYHEENHHMLERELRELFRRVESESGIAGYFWVIEYGQDSNFHAHTVVYLDGQKIRKPFPTAERIGEIWKEITEGEGKYYRCEYKESYKQDINKLVGHSNPDGIDGLRYIISYLAKEEQKYGSQIYGSSEVPPPSGLGRPRKQQGE